MSGDATPSTWLSELRRGNAQAAQQLWDAYFDKLVRLAQAKLPPRFRRAADGEDVALTVMRTFMRRAAAGEFPNVADGEDLRKLLVRITARKAWKMMEREGRQKRGGGQVLDEAALAAPGAEDEEHGIERVIGREPTPAFAAEFADTCEHRFQMLPDETLRQVARLTLEGYTLAEIAGQLGISVAGAGRKLNRVRAIWSTEE
jgi:DNA-directed RNA polymerase specialized sigma24 family protein